MGFFSKLFGGDDEAAAAAATATTEYLSTAATRAGVFDAKVEPVDGDATAMRGSLRGLPFFIRCENTGVVSNLEVHHAHVDRDDIELAVDADEAQITGKDDAGFLALAAPLQRRVLDALRTARIRKLLADATEVEICYLVRPDRLSEDLALAVDIAHARGATKPIGTEAAGDDDDDDDADDADDDDGDDEVDLEAHSATLVEETDDQKKARHGAAIAAKLAARIPGSRIVDCVDFESIDVRWSVEGVPLRIVCDWGFNDLKLEAQCLGTGVTFELEIVAADDVDLLDLTHDAEWDDAVGHYPIGHGTYVHGSRRRVLRQEALLRKLAPTDLAALAGALAEDGLDWVHLDEDEVLRSTLCNLTDVDDARIAKALTLASLYAKVVGTLVK